MRRRLRQLALASGTVQPRTEHAQLTLYPLSPLGAFPGEAGSCPLYRNGAVQAYNTSSLHPLPVKMPDTFRLRAHGLHMPLCDLNLCNMHRLPMHHRFHLSHSVLFWAHTCKSFLPYFDASCGKCYLWCQIEWHRAQSTQASQCLGQTVLGSCFPLPLKGEGERRHCEHLKKKSDEDVSTLPDLWPSLSRCSDVCIQEIARFSAIVALPTTLIVDAFAVRSTQKKKNHTREMHLLRRFTVGNGRTRFYFLAELYLLFKMDWGLRWGFLVGFCVALYFSVSRKFGLSCLYSDP